MTTTSDSRRIRRVTQTVAALVAIAAVAACSGTGGKPQSNAGHADTPRATVAMITHEQPGDSFWDLIRKGAQAAADKDNIELRYSNKNVGPDQATLVQSAIDSKVDAIAVTLAFPDAVGPVVKQAVAAGIPVTVFNQGKDQALAAGAMSYFGQDEKLAGTSAGKRLTQEGAKKVICVIQEQGSVALEDRCAGVKAGLTGGTVETLNVNGADMPSVESTITAKLQQDPSVDRVVTLGAPFALAAVKSVSNAGSQAKVATFDTNAALVDAVKSGDVEWAIDQQPYLQGYLAVDQLWLYMNNKNVIGGGQPVLTGPSFIDHTNIDTLAELAKAGTR
jgi:simple sugar transport system substrate-binding protein